MWGSVDNEAMNTAEAIFTAFMIPAFIATAIYFVVIYRKRRGAVSKHPHLAPRASRSRDLGNNGSSGPNATRANGGYNGGGGFGG